MKYHPDTTKDCVDILFDPEATQHEQDAAQEMIHMMRGQEVPDAHLVSVLFGYVSRRGPTQDRYGK